MTRTARITTALALILAPLAAQAHPGHLAEVAGHGHWLGAAAIGAAIAIGLIQGLKGRKPAQDDAPNADADADADAGADDALQEA